jgi:hypothetical protein
MNKTRILLSVGLAIFLFACREPNKYECPCGGYGKVANGTIITIDEENEGDEEKILEAIEEKLGGECCLVEEIFEPAKAR